MGDPILERREQARRLAVAGQRLGYAALGVACVAFLVGVLSDLPTWSVTVVIVAFAVATLALVPSIILGYAVRAAEREDRELRGGGRPDGTAAAGDLASPGGKEGRDQVQ